MLQKLESLALLGLFLAGALLLVACDPAGVDAEPAAIPAEGDGFIVRPAIVEAIAVNVLESFPPQYSVVIGGTLNDGCTELGDVRQRVADDVITIAVLVERPVGVDCTLALVPFETSVRLETADLVSGDYMLDVNGVTRAITIESSRE